MISDKRNADAAASNYEITKRRAGKEFLRYDQQKMIEKFHLEHDGNYLYLTFVARRYRIGRTDGLAEWKDAKTGAYTEAGFNEALTIYDVLCDAQENCAPAGEFVNMGSLSKIQGSSHALGDSLFGAWEKRFDHQDSRLAAACEKLGGIRYPKGDVAYQIPLFSFLPVVFQFWDSDEEFPASMQILTDRNILQFMRYETVWYALSHLLERIGEEMFCGRHFPDE